MPPRPAGFRFAYSSNAYTKVPLDEAIEEIARAGFDGVEILADLPHLNPLRATPAELARVRAAVHRNGLAISNLNVNTNLALSREDPEGFRPSLLDRGERREERIRYVLSALRAARVLGAPCLSISTGRRPAGVGPAVRRRLVDGLRRIMDASDREGVRVGIECEPGHLLERSDQLLEILNRVGHPRLGANLDIGHVVCAGEDPAAAIHALRGRIWNVHLEDIQGRTHRHLIPGLGNIDFARVLAALQETRYGGFLTLELYPYKDHPTRAGRQGLRVLGASARAAAEWSRRSKACSPGEVDP